MDEKIPFDPILLSGTDRDTILAVMETIRYQQEELDRKVMLWRDANFRALNLISAREAEDEKERKERQKALDTRLWWQAAGIITILLLLIALLFLFIGTRI